MSKTNDGGPAFPGQESVYEQSDKAGVLEQHFIQYPGMTLRDYFAGQALAAMDCDPRPDFQMLVEIKTKWAYQLADAMLKAREVQDGE